MRQLIEDDREWCPFSVEYIFFGRGSRFILRQHKEDIIAFGNWTANLLSAFFDTSSRFSPGEVGFFLKSLWLLEFVLLMLSLK